MELTAFEHGACDLLESGAEGFEVAAFEDEASGHFVASELGEVAGAAGEGLDEGEALDASSAAFAGAVGVEADDEGGAVVTAHDA